MKTGSMEASFSSSDVNYHVNSVSNMQINFDSFLKLGVTRHLL